MSKLSEIYSEKDMMAYYKDGYLVGHERVSKLNSSVKYQFSPEDGTLAKKLQLLGFNDGMDKSPPKTSKQLSVIVAIFTGWGDYLIESHRR